MKVIPLSIPTALQGYVHAMWKWEEGEGEAPKEFTTMADGSPGFIFQHSDKGSFSQNDKPLDPLFLYGPATKPNTMRLSGEYNTLGLFFTPHALKTMFGLYASELTDTCMDLNALPEALSFRLLERLLNSSSTEDQIQHISDFLFTQIQKHSWKGNDSVLYTLSQMWNSKGTISLEEIISSQRVSERSLERKFKEYVGLSPKLFNRICRFQASLQQLQQQSYGKLSDIAFENDYADQSHFIRNFKEFSGLSPFQFQKQANPVAGLSSLDF